MSQTMTNATAKTNSATIFALATAPGRSGVAVVRVSGPAARDSFSSLSRRSLPEPRRAVLCNLYAPGSDVSGSQTILLDRAVVLFFAAPASYTGEDVVEYHLHGGRAVIEGVLKALASQPKHRLAEPGEFTRRAFENGKLDLTEAEAVADLIHAETDAQREQALAQMGGALMNLYHGWMDELKTTLAHLEADIEFPDEDLPDTAAAQARPSILKIAKEIAVHLDDKRRGERLREGIHIAVIGAPNAGKSSLVNALARRDVAIVSDMPGTTRDIIEAHLDIGGYPVIIADTAGLRPYSIGTTGHDRIESEGMRRALERANTADLKILLFDGASSNLDEHTVRLFDSASIVVMNKSDIAAHKKAVRDLAHILSCDPTDIVTLSVISSDGIPDLLEAITARMLDLFGYDRDQGRMQAPSPTRARHRFALMEALACLMRADTAALPELMAEDIRLCVRALGRITGRVDVEDLLDIIFRDFCIGK